MDDITWKRRLERRRQRRRTERAILLVLVLMIISGVIWYVTSYTKTPNYAMNEAFTSLHSDDTTAFKNHVDFAAVTLNVTTI